jgi:hypothetical protein
MLSTWMIVASVRCDRVQVANNMLSVIMVVLQFVTHYFHHPYDR